MLKIFTIKYEEKSESFPDAAMCNFLADKDILRWESNFFERKNEYFWTVLVEYTQLVPSEGGNARKQQENKDEGYKKILSENDWPLFKVLREWRAERSKEEGVPPYIICNNMQLAKVAVTRPLSLNALQAIEGIGKGKTEKYGRDILGIIASHGQQVAEETKEEEPEDG
ncbi:HRDC domain-containing protein [Methanolobus psychrotolerans]|uniref:HRDC domain-containing protein n=1 Tax=Methanolobus psychrotolerans TaxID=1874706 RepID=UPI000B91AAF4|nr:HRDC domain-containing protein [Methanolobus psychrotolerans]